MGHAYTQIFRNFMLSSVHTFSARSETPDRKKVRLAQIGESDWLKIGESDWLTKIDAINFDPPK